MKKMSQLVIVATDKERKLSVVYMWYVYTCVHVFENACLVCGYMSKYIK